MTNIPSARARQSPRSQEACSPGTRPNLRAPISNLARLALDQPLGHACAIDSPLPPPFAFVVLLVAGWVNRQQQAVIDYLLEENRVLRAAHRPRRLHLTDDQRRRLAVKGKRLGRRRLAVAGIVTPDTILRWYRTLVAKKYDGSMARRRGRPSTKAGLAALVVRLATENPTWGYTRIHGGLKSLGHDIARNTIKAILKNYGIEPAPERGTKTPSCAKTRPVGLRGSTPQAGYARGPLFTNGATYLIHTLLLTPPSSRTSRFWSMVIGFQSASIPGTSDSSNS
jgi:hypothetical protein